MLGFLFLFVAAPASAGIFVKQTDAKGRFVHLRLDGDIVRADVGSLEKILQTIPPSIDVIDIELRSSGGDVLSAMQIGELIRRRWIWTVADDDEGAECASACVLILAAGAVRIASDGSNVIIHRPYFAPEYFAKLQKDQAQVQYAKLARAVHDYLDHMGMSPALFDEMLRVPSDNGRKLSEQELVDLNLEGRDPSYDEWIKAKNRRQ